MKVHYKKRVIQYAFQNIATGKINVLQAINMILLDGIKSNLKQLKIVL